MKWLQVGKLSDRLANFLKMEKFLLKESGAGVGWGERFYLPELAADCATGTNISISHISCRRTYCRAPAARCWRYRYAWAWSRSRRRTPLYSQFCFCWGRGPQSAWGSPTYQPEQTINHKNVPPYCCWQGVKLRLERRKIFRSTAAWHYHSESYCQ